MIQAIKNFFSSKAERTIAFLEYATRDGSWVPFCVINKALSKLQAQQECAENSLKTRIWCLQKEVELQAEEHASTNVISKIISTALNILAGRGCETGSSQAQEVVRHLSINIGAEWDEKELKTFVDYAGRWQAAGKEGLVTELLQKITTLQGKEAFLGQCKEQFDRLQEGSVGKDSDVCALVGVHLNPQKEKETEALMRVALGMCHRLDLEPVEERGEIAKAMRHTMGYWLLKSDALQENEDVALVQKYWMDACKDVKQVAGKDRVVLGDDTPVGCILSVCVQQKGRFARVVQKLVSMIAQTDAYYAYPERVVRVQEILVTPLEKYKKKPLNFIRYDDIRYVLTRPDGVEVFFQECDRFYAGKKGVGQLNVHLENAVRNTSYTEEERYAIGMIHNYFLLKEKNQDLDRFRDDDGNLTRAGVEAVSSLLIFLADKKKQALFDPVCALIRTSQDVKKIMRYISVLDSGVANGASEAEALPQNEEWDSGQVVGVMKAFFQKRACETMPKAPVSEEEN